MHKRFMLVVAFLLMINGLYPVMVQANAQETIGQRLSSTEFKPTGITVFKIGAEDICKPVIRSKGEFDVKWLYYDYFPTDLIVDHEKTSYFIDHDGVLRAVDQQGNSKWFRHFKLNGLAYLCLGQDGTIYVIDGGDSYTNNNNSGKIYSLDENGDIKFEKNENSPVDGFSYYCGGDVNGNYIYITRNGIVSIDRNGELNWTNKDVLVYNPEKYHVDTNISSLFVDRSGNTFIISRDKEIFCIDPIGKLKWKQENISAKNIYAFELMPEGYLYYRDYNQFVVLDPETGRTLADNELKDKNVTISLPGDWAGGNYYFDENQGVIASDEQGRIKWKYKMPFSEYKHIYAGPLPDEFGNVYFSDNGGNIYSLDKNGNERYIFLEKNKYYSPTKIFINDDGEVICLGNNVGLFCIGKKSIEVFVNDQKINFNVEPVIENGNILVPFRPVFESLGLKVEWDSKNKSIKGSKSGLEVYLRQVEKFATVNGLEKKLTISPRLINGSVFIPLRFIGEASQLSVAWNGHEKNVYIGTEETLILTSVNHFFKYFDRKDASNLVLLSKQNNPENMEISEENLSMMFYESDYDSMFTINKIDNIEYSQNAAKVNLTISKYSFNEKEEYMFQNDCFATLVKDINGMWVLTSFQFN